jgi:hypothetical protein
MVRASYLRVILGTIFAYG